MDLRAITSGARTSFGRWGATVLLTLTAIVAGGGLVSPVCYWQGVQRWEWDRLHRPAAYAQALVPWNFVFLALFVGWAGLWLIHARRTWGAPLALVHAGLPMAAFAAWAWQASNFAYACNPF